MKKISPQIILITTIIPVILFGIFILLFGIRIPRGDDWALIVDMLKHYYTGTFTINEFSLRYNEYILIFPKMIYFGLGIITKINMIYNLILLWLFMIFNLVILFFAFKKSFGHYENYLIYFIPISWLLFTLAQWENLCYGVTLCAYLSVFGLLVALYCLDTLNGNIRFLIAIIGGVLSTFSYINGLLTWPLGLFLLIYIKGVKSIYTIIWTIISFIIYSIYFLNWSYPAQALNRTDGSLNSYITNGAYFITNVGASFGPMESPLNFNLVIVFLFGLTIILLSIGVISIIIRKKLLKINLFWICLLAFSFLTSFVTMVGRAQFGLIQATSPRYVLFTIFSVIGLYCLILAVNYNNITNGKKWPRYLLYIFLGLIICGLLNGYIGGYHSLSERHQFEETTYYQTILNYRAEDDQTLIKNVLPYGSFIRDEIEFLDKYNLSVFANRN